MSALEPQPAVAAPRDIAPLWDEGPLARFADLERRYDGPIPLHLRDRALADNWQIVEERRAAARVKFFDDMAHFQVAAIRGRRQAGTAHAGLRRDLQLYLERRRHWRRVLGRLRDTATLPASSCAAGMIRGTTE
jgi:hypothetical protein